MERNKERTFAPVGRGKQFRRSSQRRSKSKVSTKSRGPPHRHYRPALQSAQVDAIARAGYIEVSRWYPPRGLRRNTASARTCKKVVNCDLDWLLIKRVWDLAFPRRLEFLNAFTEKTTCGID